MMKGFRAFSYLKAISLIPTTYPLHGEVVGVRMVRNSLEVARSIRVLGVPFETIGNLSEFGRLP